jgi:hypothetical protein
MLSSAVLDAAEFPVIDIVSVAIAGAPPTLTATLAVSVAGHESTIVVPFTLQREPGRREPGRRDAGRLAASGSFTLKQSSLGLTPFSVMLGALQVQDELRLKFRIVATVS